MNLYGTKSRYVENRDLLHAELKNSVRILKGPRPGLNHLGYSLTLAPKEGLILEFGVFKGTSINRIAQDRPDAEIHGFDSFEGLPEAWYRADGDTYKSGHFNVNGSLPKVPSNVTLHKGWFSETLEPFLEDHPGDVAFLNIDVDLYSSTKYVLETLDERIVPGTIIYFDELCAWETSKYDRWREHEYQALLEWLDECERDIMPVSRNTHEGATVRVTR